jgi:hypothetical protein
MHIAIVPGGVAEAAAQPSMQRPLFPQPSPSSASELLPMLEDSVKRARKALEGLDDDAMAATWRILDARVRSVGALRSPRPDAVKCPTSGEPCIDATNAGGGVSLSPSEARKKAWPGLVSVEPLAAHAQPDGGNGSATPEASSIRTRFRSDRCSRPFACASFVPSNLDLGRTTAGFRRRRRRSVT